MANRYDFMTEGVVQDEVTGSLYPDVLSMNYLNFKLSELPKSDKMTDEKIMLFWEEANEFYGSPCWDDMVLTLNNISHKNFLKNSDVIYFPKENDIVSSFTKERT